ncbi:MAG: D-alanine--D-alanine ligase [Gemmataceae bacterium]
MHVGIAFNLKADAPPAPGRPDDWYEEFDSPITVRAIGDVLRARGWRVSELGDGRPLVEKLLADPPDLVFNIAEGVGTSRSREARVPAVCEMLGIPYTGSDPLTLAVALDKDAARTIVAAAGVRVPAGGLYPATVPFPAIVKPAWEGSSKGIRGKCVVSSVDELAAAVAERSDYGQPMLVEEFVTGDEVTVGVWGNDPPRVIGALGVVPKTKEEHFVYSLEVKRDWENRVRYESPAKLAPTVQTALEHEALRAYAALGCRDLCRIDFRIRAGVPYFIEANPLPGLNPETSDLIILGKGVGVSHADIVNQVVDAALARQTRT